MFYAYLRVTIGDESAGSKFKTLPKFVSITWVGPSLPVMKRARVPVDKPMVKTVVKEFSVELQATSLADLNDSELRKRLSSVLFIK